MTPAILLWVAFGFLLSWLIERILDWRRNRRIWSAIERSTNRISTPAELRNEQQLHDLVSRSSNVMALTKPISKSAPKSAA